MQSDKINTEVQQRANARMGEVLFEAITRAESRKGVCYKHKEALDCYIRASIRKHHAYKAYRDWDGSYWMYNTRDVEYLRAQSAYRDSVFRCGCSSKYDAPQRRPYHYKYDSGSARWADDGGATHTITRTFFATTAKVANSGGLTVTEQEKGKS